MAEPEPRENILPSVEVVGNFSQDQKEEFAFLAGQILEAQGGDLQKKGEVEKAAYVAGDCIKRGLRVLGKVWFTNPDESIADAFNAGLSEREKVANNIIELNSSTKSLRLLSVEEGNELVEIANTTNPLSLDLETAEDFLDRVSERSRQISKFHRALFTDSSLSPQVELLKKTASEREDTLVAKTTPEEVMDAIYRNLLIYLTLYPGSKQLDLLIEPQDIAVVVDLWKTSPVRKTGSERLIEGMKVLAKRFGVSEEAVAVYTERMLGGVNLLVEQGGVDADSLKNSSTFIVTDESLSRQLESTNIVIPEQEAETKLAQIINLNERIEAESAIVGEENEQLTNELGGQYLEAIRSISPHELLYFLKQIAAGDSRIDYTLERDIAEEITPETYLNSLPLVYQGIAGIDNQIMEKIRKTVEKRVLGDINAKKIDLDDQLLDLPAPFLVRLIEEVTLNENQQQSLSNQGAAFWAKLCFEAGVSFHSVSDELSFHDLEFPPSTAALEHYIGQMPKDKQVEIVKGVRQEITF